MRNLFLTLGAVIIFCVSTHAQDFIKPGFDCEEYKELLLVTFDATTKNKYPDLPVVKNYTMAYRSKEMGLYNRWDLWLHKEKKVAVINIRGTIGKPESWLENFYAAMIPATGSLQVNDSTAAFNYKLAASEKAHVHVGWVLGLSYLGPEIATHIRDCYSKGYRDFIIMGHSQGGALAFLTRSYLQYLEGMPADIHYKTYCSAAPKPGDLYYAYDFDFINSGGWAYRVVNEEDWVPETPFSIQTLKDFSDVNPFTDVNAALKNQSFFVRMYLKNKYNKINKRTRKASEYFTKTLGKDLYKQVKKILPHYVQPTYGNSNNYSTAGSPVILKPDEQYKKTYIFDGKNVFLHHSLSAYYYLTNINYCNK